MTELEPLLTETELAALAQVPQGSPRGWRDRGSGPAYIKVGRHVRYRRRDVEAWLEQRRQATRDAA